MTDLLSRPIVPVASEEDARTTYERFRPYLEGREDISIRVVYVVEKAGGAMDKAGVEQREEMATKAFDTFRALAQADGHDISSDINSDILYGTDVAEAIHNAASAADASAIVFSSRGGGRLKNVLAGGIRTKLVTESQKPVVILPEQ